MPDHVYKSVELTGSSTNSVEEAINNAIKKAAASLHNLKWFEVTQIRGHIEGDSIGHYQVTMKLGFTVD